MLSRLCTAALLLSTVVGCGPEREFSGVWRQAGCAEGDLDACGPHVYELHLGRYGDDVAGLVVRYAKDATGFVNFQRPRECGCFFIEGGEATDEGIEFRLFDTTTARYPQPDTADGDLACPTPEQLTACAGQMFDLEGDGDVLTGTTRCPGASGDAGATPNGPREVEPREMVFERQVGQPRSECYLRVGSEP